MTRRRDRFEYARPGRLVTILIAIAAVVVVALVVVAVLGVLLV